MQDVSQGVNPVLNESETAYCANTCAQVRAWGIRKTNSTLLPDRLMHARERSESYCRSSFYTCYFKAKNKIMKNAILIFSLLVLSGCAENMFAQPVAEVLSKTTDGKILLEKWRKVKERAILEAGAAMDFGSPRKIRKGKNPEIVVRRDEIYLNGKRLRFGDSLENWKKVIRGNARCFDGGMILCLWDDLGIEVGTKHGSEKEVISMNLIFNLPEEDKDLGKTEYPDGTPAEKFPEYATRDVFPVFFWSWMDSESTR